MPVQFELRDADNGKKPKAVNVKVDQYVASTLTDADKAGRGPSRLRERYRVHDDLGHELEGRYIGMLEATVREQRVLIFRLDNAALSWLPYVKIRSAILIPR